MTQLPTNNFRGETTVMTQNLRCGVSYQTRFKLKEPELEPKLVLTLSKTKRLFLVVSQNSKTASFGDLVEPKITTLDAKQLHKHNLTHCSLTFFVFYSICFTLLHFVLLCCGPTCLFLPC